MPRQLTGAPGVTMTHPYAAYTPVPPEKSTCTKCAAMPWPFPFTASRTSKGQSAPTVQWLHSVELRSKVSARRVNRKCRRLTPSTCEASPHLCAVVIKLRTQNPFLPACDYWLRQDERSSASNESVVLWNPGEGEGGAAQVLAEQRLLRPPT